MDYQLRITRQNRKTIRLETQAPDIVLLRVPLRMTDREIQDFLQKHSGWIQKHLTVLREREALPPYTREEIERLAQEALRVIPEKVRHYAQLVGVSYGRITIRNQKSKWGSCSAKGNLNFNCLLMDAPEEVLDYVVVHELCHRKEMNHSPAFWAEVGRVLPDYKKQVQWLKTEGQKLIDRMVRKGEDSFG